MMQLAKDLGRTLEEIMEISTLEFALWVAYHKLQHAEKQKAARKAKNGRR
jgi:hypothetical protein